MGTHLGIPNHKVGYSEKGVWYEPTGSAWFGALNLKPLSLKLWLSPAIACDPLGKAMCEDETHLPFPGCTRLESCQCPLSYAKKAYPCSVQVVLHAIIRSWRVQRISSRVGRQIVEKRIYLPSACCTECGCFLLRSAGTLNRLQKLTLPACGTCNF